MKPIPMKEWEVRAILAGRKNVTRRVVKPKPEIIPIATFGGNYRVSMKENLFAKPPYRPGDIMYAQETWCRFDCSCCEGDTITGECLADNGPDEKDGCWMYRASNTICGDAEWQPPIHMPREAARLFLRVTGVRVERLQDITEEQAIAEGFEQFPHEPATVGFVEEWGNTLKKADLPLYGWDANPWVWVIEFQRCEKPEGE